MGADRERGRPGDGSVPGERRVVWPEAVALEGKRSGCNLRCYGGENTGVADALEAADDYRSNQKLLLACVFFFSELNRWVHGGTTYSHGEEYRGKVCVRWEL